MLYGKGNKAFYRLQLKILKWTNDHSTFASERMFYDRDMLSILSPSPKYFSYYRQYRRKIQTLQSAQASTHEVTNKGLRITLPCLPGEAGTCLAILNCEFAYGAYVGIWFERNFLSPSVIHVPSIERSERHNTRGSMWPRGR